MPNAKNLDQSTQIRFLLAGYMGSGKSTLIRSLPGRKFGYVFDPNAVQAWRGCDIDYELFCPDHTDVDISVKTLKSGVGDKPASGKRIEPKTYIEWEKHFETHYESGFFDGYDWLIMDSFTMFLDTIMDRTLWLSGRPGKQPEQADWGAQMQTCQNVWRVITSMEIGIAATAHLDLRQNDTSKKVYHHLMMTGRLRVRIPLLFNNIWVLHADRDDKGQPYYEAQTVPDKEYPTIRSQWETNPFEDVTIPRSAFKEGIEPKYALGALLNRFGYSGMSNTGKNISPTSPDKRK